MNDAFYDTVVAGATRSVIVVGSAKNVGKTVAFNALRAVAARRGIAYALTSIGRDGEPSDALDGARKPRVRLDAGTIVAVPRDLLARSPAFAILDVGEASALGPMVFARACIATPCEIGGPPTARAVRAVIDRLRELCAGPVFVDGAIDRGAPLAGGDDAIVVAVGGASGSTVDAVAQIARATVARLRIPAFEPATARRATVTLDGALDARDARDLLAQHAPGTTVVVADPTRLTVRGKLLDTLVARFDLRCGRALRIVACTTCSAGGPRPLDPRALRAAVAAATGVPAFDALAGLAG